MSLEAVPGSWPAASQGRYSEVRSSLPRQRWDRAIMAVWPGTRIGRARVLELAGPVRRKWTSELHVAMKPDQPGGKSMTIPSHRASPKKGPPRLGGPLLSRGRIDRVGLRGRSCLRGQWVGAILGSAQAGGFRRGRSADPGPRLPEMSRAREAAGRAPARLARRGDSGRRLRRPGGQAWRHPGQHPPRTHRLRRPWCADAAPGRPAQAR